MIPLRKETSAKNKKIFSEMMVKKGDKSNLAGGWTNPSETYSGRIGSFHFGMGVKIIKNIWNRHQQAMVESATKKSPEKTNKRTQIWEKSTVGSAIPPYRPPRSPYTISSTTCALLMKNHSEANKKSFCFWNREVLGYTKWWVFFW